MNAVIESAFKYKKIIFYQNTNVFVDELTSLKPTHTDLFSIEYEKRAFIPIQLVSVPHSATTQSNNNNNDNNASTLQSNTTTTTNTTTPIVEIQQLFNATNSIDQIHTCIDASLSLLSGISIRAKEMNVRGCEETVRRFVANNKKLKEGNKTKQSDRSKAKKTHDNEKNNTPTNEQILGMKTNVK